MSLDKMFANMYSEGMDVEAIVTEFGGSVTQAVVAAALIREGVKLPGVVGTVESGRVDQSVIDGITEDYLGGVLITEILERWKVSRTTFYKVLASEGISVRKYSGDAVSARIRMEEEIVEMYAPVVGYKTERVLLSGVSGSGEGRVVEIQVAIRDPLKGITLARIAKEAGCAVSTVKLVVGRHGLKGRHELKREQVWLRKVGLEAQAVMRGRGATLHDEDGEILFSKIGKDI